MRKLLIYILITLAIVGLSTQLIFNPSQLIKTTAFVIFGAVVLYVIFRLIMKNRYDSDEMRKYKQAVKQSKLKYHTSTKRKDIEGNQRSLRKRAPHLRVIDGRKPK